MAVFYYMIYFLFKQSDGYVKFDSTPEDVKFTDNWALREVFFNVDEVASFLKQCTCSNDLIVRGEIDIPLIR